MSWRFHRRTGPEHRSTSAMKGIMAAGLASLPGTKVLPETLVSRHLPLSRLNLPLSRHLVLGFLGSDDILGAKRQAKTLLE